MSGEVIAAIVVGSVLPYSVMAGVGWQLGGGHWNDPGPLFVGLIWPLVLPTLLGVRLARRLTTSAVRLPKAQVRP